MKEKSTWCCEIHVAPSWQFMRSFTSVFGAYLAIRIFRSPSAEKEKNCPDGCAVSKTSVCEGRERSIRRRRPQEGSAPRGPCNEKLPLLDVKRPSKGSASIRPLQTINGESPTIDQLTGFEIHDPLRTLGPPLSRSPPDGRIYRPMRRPQTLQSVIRCLVVGFNIATYTACLMPLLLTGMSGFSRSRQLILIGRT